MARIRTIKPEFPQSESMGRVSRDARLLFVNLWTICDDEGRTRGNSRMLASLLYPYDDDAKDLIEGWLTELEHENSIIRYQVDGATYLQITKWLDHQKIDHPGKSKIPSFESGSLILANVTETLAPDLGPRTMDLGPRTISAPDGASMPEKPPKQKSRPRKTQLDSEFVIEIDSERYAYALQCGMTDAILDLECDKFENFHKSKGNLMADWDAAWRTWCRNWQTYSQQRARV